MRFDIVSIFPEMFAGVFAQGVIGQAASTGAISVSVHDLRDFADPPRRKVDDEVYGGGAGMVFRPEPLARAVGALREAGRRSAVVLPTPAGEPLHHGLVRELGDYEQIVILCDRYEGSDARIEAVATHAVCLGDFVLTGGEIVAMAVVDAVARRVAGVVGKAASVADDSFSYAMLDHRHFTRPAVHDGQEVPAVLASGDHAAIASWRRRDGLRRTLERRPDLFHGLVLPAAEREILSRERRASAAVRSVGSVRNSEAMEMEKGTCRT